MIREEILRKEKDKNEEAHQETQQHRDRGQVEQDDSLPSQDEGQSTKDTISTDSHLAVDPQAARGHGGSKPLFQWQWRWITSGAVSSSDPEGADISSRAQDQATTSMDDLPPDGRRQGYWGKVWTPLWDSLWQWSWR